MGAQPPEIDQHRHHYHRHTPEVSTPGEPPSSHEREAGVVASLLLPHTPLRTLQPVHEARGQVFICWERCCGALYSLL